jgi:hypothetical protein
MEESNELLQTGDTILKCEIKEPAARIKPILNPMVWYFGDSVGEAIVFSLKGDLKNFLYVRHLYLSGAIALRVWLPSGP